MTAVPPSSTTSSQADSDNLPSRRQFMRNAGLSSLALAASRFGIMAGPFSRSDFFGDSQEALIPVDKKLDPAWVRALTERGTPTVYSGSDLASIGMPVGGIGAGHLYLGGDGKLWQWDIFNQHLYTAGEHYAHPMKPSSPLNQGFALELKVNGVVQRRSFDSSGFTNISFRGEYPIGTVTYSDPSLPIQATLEAFSPFIPLSDDDSSLPATTMSFTLTNTSDKPYELTVVGWLENAVCITNRQQPGTRINRIVKGKDLTFLACSAVSTVKGTEPTRSDVLFEDWRKETYSGWTVEGTAFGKGPIKRGDLPGYLGNVGGDTDRVVNSHATAPGADTAAKDSATGKLTSRTFAISRHFINLWVGGGQHPDQTCVNVVVDGKVVASVTGQNDNRMQPHSLDVRAFANKQANLEIVDAASGDWGQISVGRIVFSDQVVTPASLESREDFGEMGLALLGAPAEHAYASCAPDGFSAGPNGGGDGSLSESPLDHTLSGALGRRMTLAPKAKVTVTFLITWRFPNLSFGHLDKVDRYYAALFDSAQAVAEHLASRFIELRDLTRLWRDTWYDSTLPYWFLDRTHLNIGTLATSTAYRLRDGRFYGWEGVGSCEGTCTHVWQYEQAMGRLFPQLDIDLREHCELKPGVGFDAATGMIYYRGECTREPAVDGQAGTILRCYRDHQMQSDSSFLKRNWANIRKATQWLIQQDGNGDGIMEGAQHNTLDADWYGPVAWLSGLYLAALRASEEMAKDMGDAAFAAQCRAIITASQPGFVKRLFNGEYFVQIPDPAHKDSIGSYDGCEIDQVLGQQWAYQVGLGDIIPKAEVKLALKALWKYNFTPDVGPYRKANAEGRWFAMAGEGGLLMCTFPHGDKSRVKKGYDSYFNECMTGFEHQVAAHMIWAGMLTEGLAIERTIHDRYHASRRNPWNEVECGDHYARAMASYGVFVAACGYEYHGPKRYLAFAPRLSNKNFKAAFTAADGWGSFRQHDADHAVHATIAIAHGQLALKTLALTPSAAVDANKIVANLAGKALSVTAAQASSRVLITFPENMVVKSGTKLEITLPLA